MSKDKPKSSKTGALVMVLLVLWLAGLTGLVLMYLKKPAAGDLDTRMAKLEAKANSLVGKVNPPGTKELNDLEARVEDLEKRIAGRSEDARPVTAQTAGCDCEQLQDRLAALETAVDSESGTRTVGSSRSGQTPASEKQPAASDTASPTAAQAPSDTTEKRAGTTKKTAAKSRSKSAARKAAPPYRPGADSQQTTPVSGDAASRSNQDYGIRNLQDINRRYAPIYEGSSEDASSRGLLGPGSSGFR